MPAGQSKHDAKMYLLKKKVNSKSNNHLFKFLVANLNVKKICQNLLAKACYSKFQRRTTSYSQDWFWQLYIAMTSQKCKQMTHKRLIYT